MKKIIILVLASFVSNVVLAGENLTLQSVDLSFDTYIRVSTAAQVVEAADVSLVGQNSSFIQSLRYISSKKIVLNQTFSNQTDLETFVRDQLCKEIHQVVLNPVRDQGTKGVDSFNAKMKAQMMTTTVQTAAGKLDYQTTVCK